MEHIFCCFQGGGGSGTLRSFSRCSLIRVGCVIVLAVLLSPAVSPEETGRATSPEEEQFDFANGLYARKFCDMAAVEYRKFLEKYPGSPQRELAVYRLADCYRILGREDEAIRMYREQLESFPRGQRAMHARYRLSDLFLEKKNYGDASAQLEKLIIMPEAEALKEACLLKLGECYENQGMSRKAILTWSKIDKRGELGASAAFMTGTAYLKQGQAEKALPYFEKIAGKKESRLCPEATFCMGEILYGLKRYGDSRKAYLAACEFTSSEFFTPSVLGLLRADYRKGDFKQGREDFKRYRNSISDEALAEALFLAGKFSEGEKDFREAARIFALARNCKSGDAYVEACLFRRLWCLLKLGDDKQVLSEGKEFLKSFPKSARTGDIFFVLGQATCKLGDYEGGLSYFKRCLGRKPPSQFAAEARFMEGECYLRQERWRNAVTSFSTFTKTFTAHPLREEALLRLAESQKELSDFQTASKTLEGLLSTYPNSRHRERSLYILGACYAQQERFNDLKDVYEKLLLSNPEGPYSGDAHYWIGLAEMKNGNYGVAMGQFETVVNNYSRNTFFKNALLRLAECSYILGDREKAAGHFLKLMSVDPLARLPVKSYLWLGEYFRESKKWDEALETYALLEKNYPAGGEWHETVLYGKGKAHLGLSEWDVAAKNFRGLIDNFPESSATGEYKLLLGISLRNLKKYDMAEKSLLEAANSTELGIAAEAQFELGNVCFDREDFQGASKLYMRVFILYDDADSSPKAQLRAGKCFELMEKPEEAANCYRELVKRYPAGAYAEEAKKRLRGG